MKGVNIMTNQEFNLLKERIKENPTNNLIWNAGFLFLNLTNNQVTKLYDYLLSLNFEETPDDFGRISILLPNNCMRIYREPLF